MKPATKVVSLTLSPAKSPANAEAAPDKKEAPLEAKDTKPFKSIIEQLQTSDVSVSCQTQSYRNKPSPLDSLRNSANKTTLGGSTTDATKKSQLCALPEFQPIEEDLEPGDFIEGFEKFAEDIEGFMAYRDEQFSSVANRR